MSESHPAPDHVVKEMLWTFAQRSSDYALLLMDDAGVITWANTGAEVILGGNPGGLVRQALSRFFLHEDASKGVPEHELDEARNRGKASNDRWMARLDRSRFWATGQTILLDPQGGDRNFLKVFRDMTDAKMQLEASTRRCLAMNQSNEGLRAALALLAHELRNPLSGISLSATLLAHSPSPATKPHLDSIARNVSMAARLIDDLMEHSKVTSRGFSLERGHCRLRDLLETSTAIALRQMDEEQRVIPVLVPAGDIEMHVDQMRMQQVFVNLVANAIRYTPVPGRIWVTGTFIGNDVVVRVSDEGIGIEPERLERIFELFTLPHLEGSKLGLGLGLALVKKIVELHSGSVQAKSEGAGKGSQFTVRFPAPS